MIYNIVCVADENYAQHAAVMLCSILENKKEEVFHIFLMTYAMTDSTKQKLHQVVEGRSEEHTSELQSRI